MDCDINNMYTLQNYIFFNDEVAKNESLSSNSVGIFSQNIERDVKLLEDAGYVVYTGTNGNHVWVYMEFLFSV